MITKEEFGFIVESIESRFGKDPWLDISVRYLPNYSDLQNRFLRFVPMELNTGWLPYWIGRFLHKNNRTGLETFRKDVLELVALYKKGAW